MTHRLRLPRARGLGAPILLALAALAATPGAWAATPEPAAGSWATYRRTSAITEEVPVLVQEGGSKWSLARESGPAPELFVTYSIVRADATSYVMQIVTHRTLDGPPLSVTQVTVDRASGKATRSVIRRPQGPVATPEDGLRPFRKAATRGTPEAVEVAAGRFEAVRAPYRDGTVWVAEQAGPLGLAKASFPNGTLELVRRGTSGAKDLLRP